MVSCANRGVGPTGGPKDETPPVLKQETPANGTVNFRGNIISLLFDEYLQLNDVANQVFISPPQNKQPLVKAVGKRVTVTFEDELADSTTYTIDFGDAICDYNERIPVSGYVFSFSTGPEIDSLQMSGVLLNSENLNPMSGILVGIHTCTHDSAISSYPFTRIARTDSTGAFTVRNIRPGSYRIYALNDVSKDYVYQPGEGLAFLDSIYIPTATDSLLLPAVPNALPDSLRSVADSLRALSTDSLSVIPADSLPVLTADSTLNLRTDSLTGDSLMNDSVKLQMPKMITFYAPKDIVLRYFVEDKQRHYFGKYTREEQHLIQLTFAAPQDSLPVFRFLTEPLPADSVLKPAADSMVSLTPDTLFSDSLVSLVPDSLLSDSLERFATLTMDSLTMQNDTTARVTALADIPEAIVIQSSMHNDTIVIWLTDSAYIRQDTIAFEMTYMMSDSVYNLVPRTDTIRAIYRAPRMSASAKAALDKKKQEKKPLELKSNASNTFDIYKPLIIQFPVPVRQYVPDSIHLYEKVDSVKKTLPLMLEKLDDCGMRFRVTGNWNAETEYGLDVDSAAFVSVFGETNKKTSLKWKTVSLEEYSSLIVKIEPYRENMMLQLLDEKDKPVRTLRATAEGVTFRYIKPATYYLRAYEDLNRDSVWTTGDWAKKRQPEPVYYFPQKLTLRANWDFEETFRYLERNILEQKPQDIRKEEKQNAK
ncbi:MAG: Ig-like domain-containing protein [Paludibacteraceae bacterium]|nr:Ig-like domain-containing protein [Paludibacteraceae bacterium]